MFDYKACPVANFIENHLLFEVLLCLKDWVMQATMVRDVFSTSSQKLFLSRKFQRGSCVSLFPSRRTKSHVALLRWTDLLWDELLWITMHSDSCKEFDKFLKVHWFLLISGAVCVCVDRHTYEFLKFLKLNGYAKIGTPPFISLSPMIYFFFLHSVWLWTQNSLIQILLQP